MKPCARFGCNNQSIPRGKYCDIHRTNKRKITERISERPIEFNERMISPVEFNERKIRPIEFDERKIRPIEFEERKIRPIEFDERKINIETERKAEMDERRYLVDEQNNEYENMMRIDKLKFEENERLEILQLIKDSEIQETREKIRKREEKDDDIIIKFVFGKQNIKQRFDIDSTMSDIYDYVDMYICDNKIDIKDYELITYPNNINVKSNKKIIECFEYKYISLFIKNLD